MCDFVKRCVMLFDFVRTFANTHIHAHMHAYIHAAHTHTYGYALISNDILVYAIFGSNALKTTAGVSPSMRFFASRFPGARSDASRSRPDVTSASLDVDVRKIHIYIIYIDFYIKYVKNIQKYPKISKNIQKHVKNMKKISNIIYIYIYIYIYMDFADVDPRLLPGELRTRARRAETRPGRRLPQKHAR